MILESIVTTVNAAGVVNIAPMGPIVPEGTLDWETVELRPFKSSTTYANLQATRTGVIHVTDDVLLLARAVLGNVAVPIVPAEKIPGVRLEDCCRYYEFQIEAWDTSSDRTKATARVVHANEIRPFFGLNRAKFAIVELAIAVSRLGILPIDEIRAEVTRLRSLVEKTGGRAEHEAFLLLENRIARHAERT